MSAVSIWLLDPFPFHNFAPLSPGVSPCSSEGWGLSRVVTINLSWGVKTRRCCVGSLSGPSVPVPEQSVDSQEEPSLCLYPDSEQTPLQRMPELVTSVARPGLKLPLQHLTLWVQLLLWIASSTRILLRESPQQASWGHNSNTLAHYPLLWDNGLMPCKDLPVVLV